MALGARAGQVAKAIVGHGMKLAVMGLLIGLAGSVASAQVIKSVLFEVAPTDPVALASASIVLALVAMLACWIPAWIASRVDPLIALRTE
jgi:ABC-type antimicrobial peptide transport system permease subunit